MKEILRYISAAKLSFFRSRWSVLVMGPIYAVLLYLYLAEMVLKGAPFTDINEHLNGCLESSTNTTTTCVENRNASKPIIVRSTTAERFFDVSNLKIGGIPFDVDYNDTTVKNNLRDAESRYKPRYKPLMTRQTRFCSIFYITKYTHNTVVSIIF